MHAIQRNGCVYGPAFTHQEAVSLGVVDQEDGLALELGRNAGLEGGEVVVLANQAAAHLLVVGIPGLNVRVCTANTEHG
jgi:hypothetical protein